MLGIFVRVCQWFL